MNPNNAGLPPSRQGTTPELEQTLKIALGAVSRWLRRSEKSRSQLEAPTDLADRSAALEARGRALLASGNLPRGTRTLELTLWFSEGPRLETVELDPATEPRQVADRWFAQAKKHRRAIAHLASRRATLEQEIVTGRDWLEKIQAWMGQEFDAKGARKALRELESLRERLLCRGLWPQPPGRKDQPRPLGPVRWDLGGGWFALAGKSGTENDFLTTRLALSHDLWFHVANIPGAHVILRSPDGKPRTPPQEFLEKAAALAAWLSRYRAQEKVEVRFTERKHVRKPRKVPAGTVVMEQSRSLLVRPQAPARTTI